MVGGKPKPPERKFKMGRLIKVHDVGHAMICVIEDSLEVEFQTEFGEIAEANTYGQHIKDNDITLEDIVDFLNKETDVDSYELA